jgi:hypothetical protein
VVDWEKGVLFSFGRNNGDVTRILAVEKTLYKRQKNQVTKCRLSVVVVGVEDEREEKNQIN